MPLLCDGGDQPVALGTPLHAVCVSLKNQPGLDLVYVGNDLAAAGVYVGLSVPSYSDRRRQEVPHSFRARILLERHFLCMRPHTRRIAKEKAKAERQAQKEEEERLQREKEEEQRRKQRKLQH
eukprot:g64266.t1